jgi:mRNA-degrading endonuclease toxin of MazEF toxin-antitoxin module
VSVPDYSIQTNFSSLFAIQGRLQTNAGEDNGTSPSTKVVQCDQPRALDLGSLNARRLESVPAEIVDEVLAKLTPIFE